MQPLSVCAAVVIRGGKILLATRAPGSHLAGCWEFPGGKVRAGESYGECIKRELEEELGLTVSVGAQAPWELLYTYPERTVALHFIPCACADDASAVPREGQQCGWFAPEELSGLELAPADAQFVRDHLEELVRSGAAKSPRRTPLPPWLKTPFAGAKERIEMRNLLRHAGLHTVCEGAKCPNRCECWKHRTATFMILGDTCTRACKFCSVNHGRPNAVVPEEPRQLAESAAALGLKYVVVTCVTRDDLPDGGAGVMAETIREIRKSVPDALVEVLVSDYNGDTAAVETVLAAGPAVYGHNLETVERLTPSVRFRATYRRSLEVLSYAAQHAAPNQVIKSGLMLGLGENDDEIRAALKDLRAAGVSIVTLGQYLQPTAAQLPVTRFVTPEEFKAWEEYAERELGFMRAVCGPLVRSSYQAADAYIKATAGKR